jgi:hypothetical protein
MEEFLGVKWFDGLLVKGDHLLHGDNRVLSLFSDSYRVGVDQPGIIDIEAHSAVASQLVDIDNIIPREGGEGIDIAFKILKPFRSLAPDGSIVIAIPNTMNYNGAPTTEVKGTLKNPPRSLTDHLVCIKQGAREELAVKRMLTPDQPIELVYPGLDVDIVEVENYKSYLASDYTSYAPVALIAVEGANAEAHGSYIPPVMKLQFVEHFDTGLVDSIGKLFDELIDVSGQYLAAGGSVFSREGIGADLRTRYNFYHVLNAMLLAKSGLLKNLSRLSPFRFFYELMYPLTQWFDRYYENIGDRKSSIAPVSAASAQIRDLSHEDLSARTDRLLNLSRDFIHKLNETIRLIA